VNFGNKKDIIIVITKLKPKEYATLSGQLISLSLKITKVRAKPGKKVVKINPSINLNTLAPLLLKNYSNLFKFTYTSCSIGVYLENIFFPNYWRE
jgi:hypothetical protein